MTLFHAPDNRRAFAFNTASIAIIALAAPRVLAQAAASADKPTKRIMPVELNAFPAPAPWALMGAGALRFFGFKAYDAHLWSGEASANPLLSKTLFALEIDYTTSIKA